MSENIAHFSVNICMSPQQLAILWPTAPHASHTLFHHSLNCVDAAVADAASLCGHSAQELNSRPDQHGLGGVASKHSSANLQFNCTGWGQLLVELPAQDYPLFVADNQVAPAEACKIENCSGLGDDSPERLHTTASRDQRGVELKELLV